jgi:hypothetical protein
MNDACVPERSLAPDVTLERIGRRDRRSCLRGIGGVIAMGWAEAVPLLSMGVPTASATEPNRRTIRVGRGGDAESLAEAARIASDGDTVEVESGDYRRDTAIWTQRDLVIRGIGSAPRLIADGASAEGKATFIMRGDRVRIENMAFQGSRVRDRNGAGIRLERGRLSIAGCRFEDNENGVLTGNNQGIELTVDGCTFIDNGAGDGQSHNLYAGAIGRLTVIGSYFARARVGHLLKSRARESLISYCRLSGEDGTSSYELEFPSGGRARVVGCLIQQGRATRNATIVSFGAEGYRWDVNELSLGFCTLVNDRPGGATFLYVAPGSASVQVVDNLLVGAGRLDIRTDRATVSNTIASPADFADAAGMNYRLRRSSRLVGAAGTAGALGPERMRPAREYVHPASSAALGPLAGLTPLSPGAFQRID